MCLLIKKYFSSHIVVKICRSAFWTYPQSCPPLLSSFALGSTILGTVTEWMFMQIGNWIDGIEGVQWLKIHLLNSKQLPEDSNELRPDSIPAKLSGICLWTECHKVCSRILFWPYHQPLTQKAKCSQKSLSYRTVNCCHQSTTKAKEKNILEWTKLSVGLARLENLVLINDNGT